MNAGLIVKEIKICEICNKNIAVHEHHIFSNTKMNRKIYGKLIDAPFNKIPACEECHLWKAIPKFSEKQFRNEAIKQGYDLSNIKGSKTFQLKELKEKTK